jgi:hypothetical protein
MMKEYKKPSIKVNKITDEGSMLMSSLDPSKPTSGLDNAPTNGGVNDGTHIVNAKHFEVWNVSDLDDDQE